MRHRRTERAHGFSLIEVLVALSILATGFAALAQLALVAGHATRRARVTSVSTIAAQQKVEELYARAAVEEIGFAAGPAGSITADVPGYCDSLDVRGHVLAECDEAHAAYRRRWSIGPVAGRPALFTWQVLVTASPADVVHLTGIARRRRAGE